MLPIIRAVASKATGAAKNKAKDITKQKVKDSFESKDSERASNAERAKGLYTKLKKGNASAQAAAVAKNNENNFEQKALSLLSSINGNTEELIHKLGNEEKSGGILSGLLAGLGLLLAPMMGKMTGATGAVAGATKALASAGTKAMVAGVAKVAGATGVTAIAKKVASVTGLKAVGKGAAKMGSKLIPGIGLAVGGAFAAKRASQGDYVGALAEAVSGIASTVPGLGTAAALAIQAGLVARDTSKKANAESEKTIRSTRKGIDAVNDNAVKTTQKQRLSFNKFTDNLSDMTTKTKEKLLEGTDEMLDSIKGFMPKMFKDIGGGIKSMMDMLGDYGPKILNTIKGSVASMVAFASSPLTAVINKIKSMLPAWIGGGNDNNDIPSSNTKPSASAKENFGKVKGDLKSAATKFGVDAGLLAKIAYFESGRSFSTSAAPVSSNASRNTVYNKGAGKNALSSAHGLGQFVDKTWYGTLRKHGKEMGIGSNLSEREMDALRRSQSVQSMALAALTKDNMTASAKISGGDRGADVYAMHNLGAGRGPEFLEKLKNNPNAKVSTVLTPKEISNNPALYEGGNVTVKQAYNKMRGHIADGESFATEINGGTTLQKAGSIAKMVSPMAMLKTVVNGKEKSSKPKVSSNTSIDSSGVMMPKNPTMDTGSGVMRSGGNSGGFKIKMPTSSKPTMGRMGNWFSPNTRNTSIADAYNIPIEDYETSSSGLSNNFGSTSGIVKIASQAPYALAKDAYNKITGKNNKPTSVPNKKQRNLEAGGVMRAGQTRQTTNMSGQGVLLKKTQGDSSYKNDMGMPDYATPVLDGDKIAASAEGMIGNQKESDFGLCARAVWFILGRAGIAGFPTTKSTSNDARTWGASGIAKAKQAVPALMQRGFKEISPKETSQNGDVDVLGPRKSQGSSHAGHIQIFANGTWYSDHKQGRRYTLDKYEWVKTFRYGSGGSTGTSALTGDNSTPTMPEPAPEMSMSEKIGHMMSSVFTSDKLDGLREFIKGGEDYIPPKKESAPIPSLGEYTGKDEYVLTDFGNGPNKNGTMSDNLKRILGGNKDRQQADSSGINKTPGFTKNPDRQLGDTSGISGTTGFGGSGKQKWWERLFGGNFGTILEDVLPGFGNISGMIENKDYAGILGAVTGNEQLGKIAKGAQDEDYGGVLGEVTGNKKMGKIVKGVIDKEYAGYGPGGFSRTGTNRQQSSNDISVNDITGINNHSSISSIYKNLKNKNYDELLKDVLPSDKFMQEGLGKITENNFDNRVRMQSSRQAEQSIVTPPAQSHTVSSGSSEGAVLPISVRNNDSIIREIAKDYLKSSM